MMDLEKWWKRYGSDFAPFLFVELEDENLSSATAPIVVKAMTPVPWPPEIREFVQQKRDADPHWEDSVRAAKERMARYDRAKKEQAPGG